MCVWGGGGQVVLVVYGPSMCVCVCVGGGGSGCIGGIWA